MLIPIILTVLPSISHAETVNGKALINYLPILEKTKRRMPTLDPQSGLYIKEVKKNLFFVTDGVYQSAFFKTQEGVVLFDAPSGYGEKLPEIIKQYAPDTAVKYIIYSHGHKDHIGASSVFKDYEGLQIIAQADVAKNLKGRENPDVLLPNITFKDEYTLTLGEDRIELKNQGQFHSTDADIFIYLPRQKFLVAVDIMSPGYAPFKNFEVTPNFHRYISIHDDILSYDFDLLLSGHLGILGVRQDVIDSKEYVYDVEETAKNVLKTTPAEELFSKVLSELKGNGNTDLAYRYYLETMAKACSVQVIEKWKARLAGVDVWADGHCETALIYHLIH